MPIGESEPGRQMLPLTLRSDPQLLINLLRHALDHPEEVSPASEIEEYERCQESVVYARRRANAVEGNIYIP